MSASLSGIHFVYAFELWPGNTKCCVCGSCNYLQWAVCKPVSATQTGKRVKEAQTLKEVRVDGTWNVRT